MGLTSTLDGTGPESMAAGLDEAHQREVNGLTETVHLLEANLAQLEQALLEPGWQRLSAVADMEFTREGMATISRLCRLMGIKDPLLRRAIALKTYYVFGQGVTVTAKDETVAPVIEQLVDDTGNQRSVFGLQAQASLQRSKMTDSNIFLALFTNPATGRVKVRDLPFDEIKSVISNPEDASEPWFYERAWTVVDRSGPGLSGKSEYRRVLYPCIDYQPAKQPPTYGGLEVKWDAPVIHVESNKPRGWQFGVPELYPALDWARAHSEYLDDFRRLVKVLAKIAWSLTGVKGSQLERAKTQLTNATAEDANVGQAWVGDQGGGTLEPMMKSGGVQVEPDDARQFSLMVAAATDLPETMLKGDPSTGNLATAETLDRPTELAMEWDRRVWTDVFKRICQYAIDQAATAPSGELSGVAEQDGDERVVTLTGDVSREVSVDWPPIQERSMREILDTLVGTTAGATSLPGASDPDVSLEFLRIALTALDVDDVDTLVEDARAAVDREQQASQQQAEPSEQDQQVVEALSELREVVAAAGVAA